MTHRFAFGIDEYWIQLYSQDTNKLAGTAASTKRLQKDKRRNTAYNKTPLRYDIETQRKCGDREERVVRTKEELKKNQRRTKEELKIYTKN